MMRQDEDGVLPWDSTATGGEVGLAPVALIDCAHKVFQPQVSALVERRTCDDKKVEFGETAVGYGVSRVSAHAWEPTRRLPRHSKMKDMLSWGRLCIH